MDFLSKSDKILLLFCNKNITKKTRKNLIIEKDGEKITVQGDYVISSMPVKDLVMGMNDVPEEYREIAEGLPYRDYMTVGVLIPKLNLKNETKTKTIGNIVPDNWVYVHDKNVKMGRFQIYNNWSPYMVKDLQNTVWMGLEYFCNEGDEMWSQTDEEFAKSAVKEMVTMGLIDSENDVLDTHIYEFLQSHRAVHRLTRGAAMLTTFVKHRHHN